LLPLARQAFAAIFPLSISVVPWGILAGALAIQVGFTPIQAQCLSLFVFAGAAQLSAITMTASVTPISTILGSTVIISARHLLYSLVFKTHLAKETHRKRVLAAFLLTDEMFVVSEAHTKRTGQFSYWFAVFAGGAFYLFWNIATLIGIVIGESVKGLENFGLDFAIVATFVAMSVEQVRGRPEVVVVICSATAAILLKPIAGELYIILATLIGMMSGFLASVSINQFEDK